MGAQRPTYEKLQRERAKKAKAAAKRERRQQRSADSADDELGPAVPGEEEQLSAAELLELIEAVHKRFDAGTLNFEDFEEQKTDLFNRLAKLPME